MYVWGLRYVWGLSEVQFFGTSSENFGDLRNRSGSFRICSGRLRKSWHTREKILTPITRKKLAGILLYVKKIGIIWQDHFSLVQKHVFNYFPWQETLASWPWQILINHRICYSCKASFHTNNRIIEARSSNYMTVFSVFLKRWKKSVDWNHAVMESSSSIYTCVKLWSTWDWSLRPIFGFLSSANPDFQWSPLGCFR